ncbi:MAG: WD40/YVTN/BNR-like repeat-containing protein, partial [Myxococcota bacterium]
GLISGRGGHIYRSTDQGATLAPVASFPGSSVTALVSVPGSGRIYAAVASLSGSANDGVYVSDDEGVSFTLVNGGLHSPARVRALAVAAGAPERVYALVEGSAAQPLSAAASLYVRDAGGSWTALPFTGVDPNPGGPVLAIAADVAERDWLYLADGARIYRSTDAGQTFTALAEGASLFGAVPLANVRSLATDAQNPDRLLLATKDAGLLESTDRGSTWHRVETAAGPVADDIAQATVAAGALWAATRGQGLQQFFGAGLQRVGLCLIDPVVTAVAVAPDDAQLVFAGTTGNLYVSTDGGKRFQPSSGMDELLARVTVTGSVGWLLSAVGLYRTTDSGQTWERVAEGVGSISFSDVTVDPRDDNRLFLATDEDLFEGGGASTSLIEYHLSDRTSTRPQGLARNIAAVAFDPSSPTRVYAYQRRGAVEQVGTGGPDTGVFFSEDDGHAFSPTALLGGSLVFKTTFRFSPLAVDATGVLFAGVTTAAGPALWRSQDNGRSYSEVWTGPGWVAHGVQVDPSNNVYLVGRLQAVGIRKSTDQGATFSSLDSGLAGAALFVNHLAFTSGGGILAATQDGAYYAADGNQFSAFNTGLTGTVAAWSVAVLPGSPPTALMTTDQGVFRRQLP